MKPKEVIEALKACSCAGLRCRECPYLGAGFDCMNNMMLDAAELLEKAYGKEERA